MANNKKRSLFLFMLLFFSLFTYAEGAPRYPFVSDLKGPVFLIAKNGSKTKIRKKQIFQKSAIISTAENLKGEKSQVKIELDEETTLLLGEDSKVEFPSISYEEGMVTDLHLLSGQMRVQARGGSQRFYSTLITHLNISNADFVLNFDPHVLKTQIFVLDGALDFRGTEADEVARVQAHEKCQFSGQFEEGQPGFDILLGGKRVARGKLGIVEPLTPVESGKIEGDLSLKKMETIRKVVIVKRAPDQICDKPFGKLNECSWSCEKWDLKKKICVSSCIRRRCNANGEWADPYENKENPTKCLKNKFVEPCHY